MGKEDNVFGQILSRLYEENHFMKFDEFIVGKFVDITEGEPLTEAIRKTAYQNFYHAVGRVEIAAPVTMYRWFGLFGHAKPNRMHIFHMAFCLKLSREQTEEYLLTGLNENSFQINDYHEMIYLYGIENAMTFEQCQQMIDFFEKNLTIDMEISHTRSTKQMMQQYEQKKCLPANEFLLFMTDNKMYFKGYSNTALSYLQEYHKQVLVYIRKDAGRRLEELLNETDYREWKQKSVFLKKKDSYDLIRKYLKSSHKRAVSEMLAESILELAKIVYSGLDNRSQVHNEIFYDSKGLYSKSKHSEVRNMTMKHMSDLLRVAERKEEAARVRTAVRMLENINEDAACPSEVLVLLEQLTGEAKQDWNCGEALLWLRAYQKEHRRRELEVQRGDLLPFVLYVAQQRYLEQIHGDMEAYKQAEARQLFWQSADGVLTACNMQPLQENRELDAVLLACFQEEEMYGYPDVLEALYGE
ncbi:MAG: hypothetical protein NC300_12650 [Bacteroidales bacterium]|nr:hypothetical protein [Clostridium sp.]MCM1204984.1 hypothetical protein [Bacteroidales bacterium]